MAGEYYRWLARDVKPEEKRELTREEKLKNWWHYHKWHVLIAAVVLLLAVNLGGDILTDYRNTPDYSVAYVGSSYLPEDTVEQLEKALEQLGEDLNGRGGVQVAVNQYIIYPNQGMDLHTGSMNQTLLYTEQVKFVSDLENGTSYLFLMENPEQFQQDYEVLAGPDGAVLWWRTTKKPIRENLRMCCPACTSAAEPLKRRKTAPGTTSGRHSGTGSRRARHPDLPIENAMAEEVYPCSTGTDMYSSPDRLPGRVQCC